MQSLLDLIASMIDPEMRHKVINLIFGPDEEWDKEAFKKILTPPVPLANLEPYEKALEPYLIFTEDTDGAVYIGKGLHAEVKKAIKAYFKAGGGEFEADDFSFEGKGPYFNYTLEQESCEFFPTLSEATSMFDTHMSRPVEIAMEKLFFGKPLYITDVGELLFKILRS